MDRRDAIRVSGASIGTALTSGCASRVFGGTAPEERHQITVLNGADEPHAYEVAIGDGSGNALFERRYELDANEGDENRVFEGDPATVSVVIDGTYRKEFGWNPNATDFAEEYPDGCHGSNTVSLQIRLWGDEVRDGFEGTEEYDHFRRDFGCAHP